MGTRKGRAKAFDTSRPSAWDQTKQHEEEEQDQKQHRVVLPTWKYWYRK